MPVQKREGVAALGAERAATAMYILPALPCTLGGMEDYSKLYIIEKI
jgi:hypothetical protein